MCNQVEAKLVFSRQGKLENPPKGWQAIFGVGIHYIDWPINAYVMKKSSSVLATEISIHEFGADWQAQQFGFVAYENLASDVERYCVEHENDEDEIPF